MYGKHLIKGPFTPCETIGELAAALINGGLSGAVVYCYDSDTAGVGIGNEKLLKDISDQKKKTPELDLIGAYTVVPSCTNETVPPDELPAYMKANGFGCIRFNPYANCFMCSPTALEDYLQISCEKKIPVLFDAGGGRNPENGMTLEHVDFFLRDFPDLTAVLFYDNVWPNDRFLRPLVKRYKNLCLNTAHFVIDGIYEEYYSTFGCDRLMHGSCYPQMYMGCNMLMIKHAEIPSMCKNAIAGENLLRVVKGWRE